ncbi:MAG: cupin domain-containing protein [Proteobacteria bacterium]|nr:cupin domain-containing protein [Pseudomonadota bacterium]
MSTSSIIRIDHKATLERWPDYAESDIASGTRVNHGKIFYEDKAVGLSTGVWEQDVNESHWMVYPVHEFMLVLEGAVTIREEDRETTISAGESFVIPKGLKLKWIQKVRMRKVFVILDDPGDGPKGLHTIKLDHQAKLEPSTPPAPPVLLSSPPPSQHTKDYYEAVAGRFTVGVWDTTPYTRKLIEFPRWELMHLLEGRVTLTDGAGGSEDFVAGETFFVPHKAPNAWQSHGYLRKLFAILMPAA